MFRDVLFDEDTEINSIEFTASILSGTELTVAEDNEEPPSRSSFNTEKEKPEKQTIYNEIEVLPLSQAFGTSAQSVVKAIAQRPRTRSQYRTARLAKTETISELQIYEDAVNHPIYGKQ